MGSGGGTDVSYEQSPQQAALLNAIMPMVQGIAQYGTQRYFGGQGGGPSGMPGAGTPGMGGGTQNPNGPTSWGQKYEAHKNTPLNMGAPSMGGVMTGQQMYDIPNYMTSSYNVPDYNVTGYGVPDASTAMPTANWWSSLSPNVKAGLYAPYAEAGRGMMEAMGSRGQLGSASGGLSGATGAAMGKLAGEAAQNVGLNAWQMTSPAALGQWNAQLGANQYLANQQNLGSNALFNANLGQNQYDANQQNMGSQNLWNANLNRNQQAYNVGQQERVADYNTAMNVWQMPQQLIGMTPNFLPQGIVQPQSNTMGNMFGGGMMGGMAGGSMFGPWGAAIGGGLGALSGAFS